MPSTTGQIQAEDRVTRPDVENDRRKSTANEFGFSGVLLVVMAISKDRLDERIPESDKAQRNK